MSESNYCEKYPETHFARGTHTSVMSLDETPFKIDRLSLANKKVVKMKKKSVLEMKIKSVLV